MIQESKIEGGNPVMKNTYMNIHCKFDVNQQIIMMIDQIS